MTTKNTISRRTALKAGGLAAAGMLLGPRFLLRPALAGTPDAPVLVHLFLRGGMDGLSAVVPYADPDYAKLRRSTHIHAPAKGREGTAIELDGRFGLHPALAALKPDYDAKRLAIVHAVGSPDPTRSHFDAQDYMETGTPGVKGTDDGWISRFVTGQSRTGLDETFRTIALSATLPRCMKGDAKALAIANFNQFTVGGGEFMGDAFGEMYGAKRDTVGKAGREAFDAVKRLKRVDPAQFKPENGATYPRGRLGRQLLSIAQMVKAGIGLQVAFAEGGGWDTHLNQGGATCGLANRLREVGDSLHAFSQDLGDRMKNVVVVTLTEFGRTAKENGTNGTDHGHASVSFALGGAVKGGKVHGRWPGLSQGQLYQKRDLAVTTDFRDILSEVLTNHLGAGDLGKVFPDHKAKKVGLIA